MILKTDADFAEQLRIRRLVAESDKAEILPEGGFEGLSGFGDGAEGFEFADQGLRVGAGPEAGFGHPAFEVGGMVELRGETKGTP